MNILTVQKFRRFSGFGSPQIVIYNSRQKAIVNKSVLILFPHYTTVSQFAIQGRKFAGVSWKTCCKVSAGTLKFKFLFENKNQIKVMVFHMTSNYMTFIL